jgi:uncharacterized protein involved in exopolysaccharide biosynthesis
MVVVSEDDRGLMGALLGSVGGGGGGGVAALAGFGGNTKTDLYVTMLKTETIKDPIIERFALTKLFKAKKRSNVYRKLDAITKISAGKKDGVITITVSDKDPKLAADLANAYVEELGKLAASLSMNKSAKNRQFLEERLTTTKANLVKAEDLLKAFQLKNKVLDVPEQAKVSIKEIALLHGKLATQEILLSTLRNQYTDTSFEVKTAAATVANIKAQIAKLEGSEGTSSIPKVGDVPQLGQEYMRLLREFKIQETLLELLTKQYEMAKFTEAKDVSPVQIIQVARVPDMKSKPSRSQIVILFTFMAFSVTVLYIFFRDKYAKLDENNLEKWRSLKKGLLSK